jgi:hypothetical protein
MMSMGRWSRWKVPALRLILYLILYGHIVFWPRGYLHRDFLHSGPSAVSSFLSYSSWSYVTSTLVSGQHFSHIGLWLISFCLAQILYLWTPTPRVLRFFFPNFYLLLSSSQHNLFLSSFDCTDLALSLHHCLTVSALVSLLPFLQSAKDMDFGQPEAGQQATTAVPVGQGIETQDSLGLPMNASIYIPFINPDVSDGKNIATGGSDGKNTIPDVANGQNVPSDVSDGQSIPLCSENDQDHQNVTEKDKYWVWNMLIDLGGVIAKQFHWPAPTKPGEPTMTLPPPFEKTETNCSKVNTTFFMSSPKDMTSSSFGRPKKRWYVLPQSLQSQCPFSSIPGP